MSVLGVFVGYVVVKYNEKKRLQMRKRKGFTLIEIIVVLCILGVLTGFAAVKYKEHIQGAEEVSVKSSCALLESELIQRKIREASVDTYDLTDIPLPLELEGVDGKVLVSNIPVGELKGISTPSRYVDGKLARGYWYVWEKESDIQILHEPFNVPVDVVSVIAKWGATDCTISEIPGGYSIKAGRSATTVDAQIKVKGVRGIYLKEDSLNGTLGLSYDLKNEVIQLNVGVSSTARVVDIVLEGTEVRTLRLKLSK